MILRADKMSALIVAADHYEDPGVAPLRTPAHSVVDVMEWLATLGVNWDRVVVHVSATEERQTMMNNGLHSIGIGLDFGAGADPETTPIAVRKVDHASIGKSIADLCDVDGETLVVFFMGHGVFSGGKTGQQSDRMFLCADRKPGFQANVAISSVVDKLQMSKFDNAFVFYDACSKIESAESEAPNDIPQMLANPTRNLNRNNGVLVAFAAQQYAEAIEKPDATGAVHSVFLHPLLDELQPERVNVRFMESDRDNEFRVDAAQIVKQPVSERVQAATNGKQQPEVQLYGRFATEDEAPIFSMPHGGDVTAFDALKSEAEEWDWEIPALSVKRALDYRTYIAQARSLYFLADNLRDLARVVQTVEPVTNEIFVVLWRAHQDVSAVALDTFKVIPADLPVNSHIKIRRVAHDQISTAFTKLQRVITQLQEATEGESAEKNSIAAGVIADTAETARNAAFDLRIGLEDAYAMAVWLAVRELRGKESQTGTRAVELLKLWVVLTDAPRLANKAALAGPVANLVNRHLDLEPTRWWPDLGGLATAEVASLREEMGVIAKRLEDVAAEVAVAEDALPEVREGHQRMAALIDNDIMDSLERRLPKPGRYRAGT